MNEVIMTVGRHGLVDINFGIAAFSMADAYFSAQKLKTYGRTLILTSPLERAVITAKIRCEVMGCELVILDELSQNNFFGLKPREQAGNLKALYEKVFRLAERGNYNHVHLITHMPVMDALNLPVCNDCEYIEIKASNWLDLQKIMLQKPIPCKRGASGRPQVLAFLEKNGEIPECYYSDFLEYMTLKNC